MNSIILAAAASSLFFTDARPLNMPTAQSYLVTQGDGRRELVDKFDTHALWDSRAVLGRWEDSAGRLFTVARLDAIPPTFEGEAKTRSEYMADCRVPLKNDDATRARAVSLLTTCSPYVEPQKPRFEPSGIKRTFYYQGTNTSEIVCAFLPEKSAYWYVVEWLLAEGDDFREMKDRFEEDFLEKWDEIVKKDLKSESDYRTRTAAKRIRTGPPPSEREFLRADARHSVCNYRDWRVTDGDEFTILDNLPSSEDFIVSLTNDMKRMRAKYAETLPSPIDGSNVLCVARIFRNREDYLNASPENEENTAAHWSPSRREIVAYLPSQGEEELLKTMRHEAFHQYLSYATAMAEAPPWFNEGYAQYFEDVESSDWEMPITKDKIKAAAALIPSLLIMNYKDFYAGTRKERHFKYRLAWSIVYFIENGIHDMMNDPFKKLKQDCIEGIISQKDAPSATMYAFRRIGSIKEFVEGWVDFWTK